MTQQQPQGVQQDPLLQMFMEIQRERKRLGELQDPSTRKLAMEMADTILSLLQDTVGSQLEVRNWAVGALNSVDQRLSELEEIADDAGGLDEDEATKIIDIASRAEAMAQAMLDGSPNADESARQELLATITLAKEVINIVADNEDGEVDPALEARVEAEANAAVSGAGANGAAETG